MAVEKSNKTKSHRISQKRVCTLAGADFAPLLEVWSHKRVPPSTLPPHIPASLDPFLHAAEHLGAALAAAYGDGSRQARTRFQELREVLLEDCNGVEQIIRSLVHLRTKRPRSKRIRHVLGCFRKHRHKMRYLELKEMGMPIGSEPVEARCKTLVAQAYVRGMRGGQGILTVRGWTQSGRFDHAWAVLAASYSTRGYSLDNVLVFPSGVHARSPSA